MDDQNNNKNILSRPSVIWITCGLIAAGALRLLLEEYLEIRDSRIAIGLAAFCIQIVAFLFFIIGLKTKKYFNNNTPEDPQKRFKIKFQYIFFWVMAGVMECIIVIAVVSILFL